jgi:hypothetical protein
LFSRPFIESILVPHLVESFPRFCFADGSIERLAFEPESQLKTVEDSCFQSCSLGAFRLPCLIEFVGESCFAGAAIKTIYFEAELYLRQAGKACFEAAQLKLI